MVDVLKLQAKIWRGGRYEGGEDHVGTIWEGTHMEKYIYRKGYTLALQSKDGVDKVKAISLNNT